MEINLTCGECGGSIMSGTWNEKKMPKIKRHAICPACAVKKTEEFRNCPLCAQSLRLRDSVIDFGDQNEPTSTNVGLVHQACYAKKYAKTESVETCGQQAWGFMPACVLPKGHTGEHQDGFGGHYGEGTSTVKPNRRAIITLRKMGLTA